MKKLIASLNRFVLITTVMSALVLSVFYYVACTEAGLQMVWGMLEKRLPEKLHVGSLHGNLISNLTIENLSYQDETASVSVRSLYLHWDVLKLLRRQFVIHNLDVSGVVINVQKGDSAPSPSSESSSFDLDKYLKLLKYVRVEHITVNDADIKIQDAHLTIDGSLENNWNLQWSLQVPELNHLTSEVSGKVSASGVFGGDRLHPDVQVKINLNQLKTRYFAIQSLSGSIHGLYSEYFRDNGVLKVNGLSIEGLRVPDFILKLSSELLKDNYQLQAAAILSPVNIIKAELSLPKFLSTMNIDQPFHATANVDVKDFSQFNTLFTDIPQVRSLSGQVTGSFKASGTLLHPEIEGGLQAVNGGVFVTPAGMQLSNIRLDTNYHNGRPVNLRGTFNAGQGNASIEGTYGLEEDGLPLMLRVRGSDILVYNTKEYKVKISPDILLSYRDNDLVLSGKVAVPYAMIAPVDFSTTATLPSDVVIVNKKSATSVVPTNVSLQVQLVLGDDVNLQYRDLKTTLHGEIDIFGKPGRPLTASGAFTINDGTYKAYGRKLNIQQGRLIYAGNLLTNPGISLRASQTIKTPGFGGSSTFNSSNFQSVYSGSDSVTVGIAVSGVIDKPRITLFSDDPGLSQGDILSYLLFGYPQSQASGASSLALIGVAQQMYGGSTGQASPTESLQNKLGLDELSVGTTEYYDASAAAQGGAPTASSATTVNLGRNLGHYLSLHYSVGLFQQVQVFSIRYQISRHFAIQTETSTLENGGDLLYQLESAH